MHGISDADPNTDRLMTCNPKPTLTRRQWGRGPYPVGSIPFGVVDSIRGILWIPDSARWWIAIGGVISSCDQKETQRAVLQAIRRERGSAPCLAVAQCSKRTWEGWEQGRSIPCEIVLALHRLICDDA